MYITITTQYKGDKEIRVYEGGPASHIKHPEDDPAETVRHFYQYAIYEEGVDWIDNDMTKEEFNAAYASGQRMFWLMDGNTRLVLTIDNKPEKFQEDQKNLKYRAELLDQLLVYSYNYMQGYLTTEEFTEIAQEMELRSDDYRKRQELETILFRIEDQMNDRMEEKLNKDV